MSSLLIYEEPLLVLPGLAVKVGLNEAIFLQQVHHWLQKSKHEYDGRKWVYNTYEEWNEQFPFWSVRTLKRIVSSLEKKELLITTSKYNKGINKRKWYAVNYQMLELVARASCQSGTSQRSSCPVESANLTPLITENTTEITTESVVDNKRAPEFEIGNEGILAPQDAVPTSELDADSSQEKISLAEYTDYRQQVMDKYIQRRGRGLYLSMKDEQTLGEIIQEGVPLQTVLQGIDKAFDNYKPEHSRDKIRSLNYCVPVILGLHAKNTKKSKQASSKPRNLSESTRYESQEQLSGGEQSNVTDEELQALLSRMKSGGNEI